MTIIKGNHAGLGGAGAPGGPLSGFYSHTIDQSLRIDGSAYLSKTWGSAADSNQIFTFSAWIKKVTQGDGSSSTDFSIISSVNAGSGTGQGYTVLGFYRDDELFYYTENGGYNGRTKLKLRDYSSWYHFVWQYDTTQSTENDRLKFYINGEHIVTNTTNWTNAGHNLYPGLNSVMSSMNQNGRLNEIGNDASGTQTSSSFYIAEVIMLDGVTQAASAFGETKDGVWIPKAYSGSFGANGYHLDFADSSAIGNDVSGNNNDWTANSLAASDVVPDSPTGKNFATMNPLMIGDARVNSSAVYSEGNLKVAGGGFTTSSVGGGYSTIAIPKDKKIYIEVCETDTTGDLWSAGILIDNHAMNSTTIGGNGSIAYYNRSVYVNGSETDYGSSAGIGGLGVAKLVAGDVLGIAVDGATGKVWFHRNGTYFKSPSTNNSGTTGNPSAGTNEIGTIVNTNAINPSGEIFFFIGNHGSSDNCVVNFGQESTFAGSKSAGSETDSNGDGLFQYAVPTDYVCLHSGNMSDITIGPDQSTQSDDYFNTVLYTGNGSTQSITGVGFQPDWTWIKNRSTADAHALTDSVRGVTKELQANSTAVESTNADGLTAFGADGFSLGDDDIYNTNTESYVSWNWKGGGNSNTFNIDGTGHGSASDASLDGGNITPTGASINTTSGISIISYTGNGSVSQTIKHGLSSAPEFIIIKDRDSNSSNGQWQISHTGVGDDYGYFTSDAFAGVAQMVPTGGDATTNTIGIDGTVLTNESGDDFIMYSFHSVDGFQAIGTYKGNSSADGSFVYTGFTPAFVVAKSTQSGANWMMYDNKRLGVNPVKHGSYIDYLAGEASDSDVDFLSNGFKWRRSSPNFNQTGYNDYLFWAIAEAPFKFANAK